MRQNSGRVLVRSSAAISFLCLYFPPQQEGGVAMGGGGAVKNWVCTTRIAVPSSGGERGIGRPQTTFSPLGTFFWNYDSIQVIANLIRVLKVQ